MRGRQACVTWRMGEVVHRTFQHPGSGWVPEHFKEEERLAWRDIVSSIAPLQFMEEVDIYFLELAACTLASFRTYAPYVDELTRARHSSVLHDMLEHALVPERAIKELLRVSS
jgi:hypothetical protein